MGGRRWYVVVCYLVMRDALSLESVVVAIVRRPRGTELLFAFNFSTDLESPDKNKRDKAISSMMPTEGLDDKLEHFLPRKIL